jgi:hypothetical protein
MTVLGLGGCLGLDYFTPQYDDTAISFVEPDVDSDADADIDPISVASIDPTYGTNAGGTTVLVEGGPFNSSAQVQFGADPGIVINVSTNSIRVATPTSNSTGEVDVTVTTNQGQGTLEDAYTFYSDATGIPATIGEISWVTFLGNYWSDGTSYGLAWWSYIEPDGNSASFAELAFAPSLDSCASNYSPSGTYYPMDLGLSSTTVRVDNRAISLSWDSSYYYWNAELNSSDFVPGRSYNLEEVTSADLPSFSIDALAQTPTPFVLSNPNLSQLGYLSQSQMSFAWGNVTGDEFIIVVQRVSSTTTLETVSCRAANDGNFSIPTGTWSGWGGDYMIIQSAILIDSANGTVDFNNASTGVAGMYWLVGAAYMN